VLEELEKSSLRKKSNANLKKMKMVMGLMKQSFTHKDHATSPEQGPKSLWLTVWSGIPKDPAHDRPPHCVGGLPPTPALWNDYRKSILKSLHALMSRREADS
jgi:hypothetical protein